MKIVLLINVKMHTVVGQFNIYQHDKYKISEYQSKKKYFVFEHLVLRACEISCSVEYKKVL